MKNVRKIISMLLSALLIAAVTVPGFTAFAATDYSITIHTDNPALMLGEGFSVIAYKLFDATYADTDGDGENDAYAYTYRGYLTTNNYEYEGNYLEDEELFALNEEFNAVLSKYFTITPTKTVSANDYSYWNESDEYVDRSFYVSVITPKTDEDFGRALADDLQPYLKYMPRDDDVYRTDCPPDETNSFVLRDLPGAGYYLVTAYAKVLGTKHSFASEEEAEEYSEKYGYDEEIVTAALALTTTDPTADITLKADVPSLDKTVGTEGRNAASYDIGDAVPFTITSAVPATDGYETYKFIIHDVMSSGLTFNKDSVVVTIGGDEAAKNIDYVVAVNTADGCTFEVQIADLLKKANGERKWSDGDEIVVTYSATLNAAALNTASETNSAKLQYSNNPFDPDSTAQTPEDKVFVYDFEIDVDKYTGSYDGEATYENGKKYYLMYSLDGSPYLPVIKSDYPGRWYTYRLGDNFFTYEEDGYRGVFRPDYESLLEVTVNEDGNIIIPKECLSSLLGNYTFSYEVVDPFMLLPVEELPEDYLRYSETCEEDYLYSEETGDYDIYVKEHDVYAIKDIPMADARLIGPFCLGNGISTNRNGDYVINFDEIERYETVFEYDKWDPYPAQFTYVLRGYDESGEDCFAVYDETSGKYYLEGTTDINEAARFYSNENGYTQMDIVIGDIEKMDYSEFLEFLPVDCSESGILVEPMYMYWYEQYVHVNYPSNDELLHISFIQPKSDFTEDYSDEDWDEPRLITIDKTTGLMVNSIPESELTSGTSGSSGTSGDSESGCSRLPGAKFVLVNNEGKFYKYENNDVAWVDDIADATEVITDANGAAQFRGLKEGVYFLRETEAPAGYNLLTEDVRVNINAAYSEDGSAVETNAILKDKNNDGVKDTYVRIAAVKNETGRILPSTGGIGTTIFYIVGAILVVAAAVFLITKRRMSGMK